MGVALLDGDDPPVSVLCCRDLQQMRHLLSHAFTSHKSRSAFAFFEPSLETGVTQLSQPCAVEMYNRCIKYCPVAQPLHNL